MATSFDFGALMGGREFTESCDAHGEYVGKAYRLGGADRRSPCPKCAAEAALMAQRQAEADRARARVERATASAAEALSVAKVPARFVGKTFDSYRAETPAQQGALTACRQYAEEFAEHRRLGTGLTLTGGHGTGKSHLASAIIHRVIHDRSALYATVSDMVRSVRDTWRRDSAISTGQMIERLRGLDLLVLDEVGVQSGTDGEHSIVCDVLDGRYRDCAPTILLTNLGPVSMKEAVGNRIFDRLRETSKWVKFDWESYRPKAREID